MGKKNEVEVDWMILCDHHFRDANGKASLIGLFDRVLAAKIPGHHQRPAWLCFALIGAPLAEVAVQLDVVTPSGETLLMAVRPGMQAEVPERIGRYAILGVLGEGGMGTVYLAEQTEPVRRQVALKVIKLGMDTVAVLKRFSLERQALAVMSHDYIAKVFDAGTTGRGQPYFVMEHVEGIPLTQYCDRHKLSLKERIELFQKVCAGVQHAHQKGVIHRDLKPQNILVGDAQGTTIPKIIDFGLARATDQMTVQHSLFTEQGVVIGTPEYMAPEQADPSATDIDTRTDIYSLGVVLYEVLVGVLPVSRQELQASSWTMMRAVHELEPLRPSMKLSSVGPASTEIAAVRRTTPAALRRELKYDLDWIVLKAMEKERDRRYSSVAELSSDLERYLRHEPLIAGPPSAAYRLRKLARRHRGPGIHTKECATEAATE